MIVTDSNFDTIISTHKLIMIDFWAEWCGPCKKFTPVIEDFTQNHSIWLGKVNIDENQTSMEKYDIRSIPTVLLFKDGEVVKRLSGAYPTHVLEEEFAEWLQ